MEAKIPEEIYWEKQKKLGDIKNGLIVSLLFLGLAGYLFAMFYGLAQIDSAVKAVMGVVGGQ